MNYMYDIPYGYNDEVPFIKKKWCDCDGGGSGRSDEQKEIDKKQDEEISEEIKRSTTVDEKQSEEIDKINSKIEELDKPPYYETDDE
jgi:hypothetical protein